MDAVEKVDVVQLSGLFYYSAAAMAMDLAEAAAVAAMMVAFSKLHLTQ